MERDNEGGYLFASDNVNHGKGGGPTRNEILVIESKDAPYVRYLTVPINTCNSHCLMELLRGSPGTAKLGDTWQKLVLGTLKS